MIRMIEDEEYFVFRCDRCQEELQGKGVMFEVFSNRGHSMAEENFELCHSCSLELVSFMKTLEKRKDENRKQ